MIVFNKEDIQRTTRNIKRNFQYGLNRLEKEKCTYEEKIEKVNSQLKQVYIDKLENKITEDLFLDIQADKQKEIEQIKKMLEETEKRIQDENSKEVISAKQVENIANEFLNSTELKKETLFKLINRIELDSNRNLKIQFAFSDMLKRSCKN